MHKGLKIAIGALATSLMAWGAHGPLGSGQRFLDNLQSQSEAAIAEIGTKGVNVAFSDAPLSRVALLSGVVSATEKDAITKAVASVPGVSAVRWVDSPAATAAIPAGSDLSSAPDPDAAAQNEAAPSNTSAPVKQAAVAPVAPVAVSTCQTNVNQVIGAKTISFRSGSAYLSPAADPLLNEIAAAIKSCKGVTVEVGGHTDAKGPAEINVSLSQERANRVRDALVERGVPASMLSAKGYGPAKLANPADGLDPANRRTSFTVSQGGA